MIFSATADTINPKLPRAVLLLLAFVTLIGATVAAFTVSFRSDLDTLLTLPSAERDRQTAFLRDFPHLAQATTLAVEADSITALRDPLESALIDLWLAEGVAHVASILSLPGAATAPLSTLWQDDPLARTLLSQDQTLTLVTITWTPAASPVQQGEIIAAFAATLGPAARVTDISPQAVSRSLATALQADQTRLLLVSVSVCIVLALWVMGGWRAALVVTVPPLAGLILAIGLVSLLGVALNPLLMVVPTVLLVLGVADAIHFAHAMALARARLPVADAAWAGLRDTWPAAVLTSVSTGLAFGMMALMAPGALGELALFGLVGLGVQTGMVAAGTAALFAVLAPPPRREQLGFGRVSAMAGQALRRPRLIALGSGALLAVTALSLPLLTATHDLGASLPRDAPLTRLIARVDAELAGADRLFLVAPAADPSPGIQPEDARRLSALLASGLGLEAPLDSTRPEAFDTLSAADGRALAVPVPMPLLAPSSRLEAQAQTLTRAARTRLGDQRVHLVGPSLTAAAEMPDLLFRLSLAFYATAALIGLGAWAMVRSARTALVFLVPNLLTMLSVSALFVLTGQALTMTGAIVLTVAFGIAVDDTIHLVHRLRRQGADPVTPSGMAATLAHAAPPVIRTTVLVGAGFATLVLSGIPAIQGAGLVLALAAGLALVFDLFVLPALLLGRRIAPGRNPA